MKSLFLEIPPAALYVIIAVSAIIIIAGLAVAVYLQIKLNKDGAFLKSKKRAKTATEQQPEETVVEEPITEQPAEEVTEQPEEPIAEVAEPEVTAEEVVEPEPVEEVTEEPVAEVAEQPVHEEPAAVIIPPVQTEEADEPDDEDELEISSTRQVARTSDGHIRYIIIKYNKSFTAKLIQSQDTNKNYYSELKNELLSYKGVKNRVSWKYETFYAGRQTFARLSMRGKKLCIFLALDPKKYIDTKYIVDDKSEVLAYEKTPLLYRIKNDRRLKYAKELIEEVMDGREKAEDFKEVNYVKAHPYEEIEPLVERKLVKVLTEEDAQSGDVFKPRDFVEAAEVNELLQDDIAQALIEVSDEVSDKTKCAIVNVDILSQYFENDEKVTLEEIKKRVPKFPKNATYIKVLARGLLNKRLTVVADAYSIEAAKMILLTGGNPIKKR